jgi:hypothetical protein
MSSPPLPEPFCQDSQSEGKIRFNCDLNAKETRSETERTQTDGGEAQTGWNSAPLEFSSLRRVASGISFICQTENFAPVGSSKFPRKVV